MTRSITTGRRTGAALGQTGARRSRSVLAAGAVLALTTAATLTACGGSNSGVSAGTTTAALATTTTAAPTTVPATTAAPSTAPVTTASPTTAAPTSAPATTAPHTTEAGTDGDIACGNLDTLLDTANILTSTSVDWDGDGTQEATAFVYETATGNGDYRLRIEQDGGVGSEMALIADGTLQPSVIGTAQVDFSLGVSTPQPEEILVAVGGTPSGYKVGVFYKDDQGCIARFKGADEAELSIPISTSPTAPTGLACEGTAGSQFLVRTSATPGAGSGEFDVHDVKLRRQGGQLLDDVDVPSTITDDGSAGGPLARYNSITNCNVTLPGD